VRRLDIDDGHKYSDSQQATRARKERPMEQDVDTVKTPDTPLENIRSESDDELSDDELSDVAGGDGVSFNYGHIEYKYNP
jgi:hypothetical protein